MFTVTFHSATTTPFQPGLNQLVRAALAECDAEMTGLEAEWRLPDGALLYLFGEDHDGGMLAEYPAVTDSVAAALHAILRRTHCFLIGLPSADGSFVRAMDGVGDPRGVLVDACEIIEVDEAGLQAFLDEIKPNRSAEPRPVHRPIQSPPKSSGRSSPLMDFLFGKAV